MRHLNLNRRRAVNHAREKPFSSKLRLHAAKRTDHNVRKYRRDPGMGCGSRCMHVVGGPPALTVLGRSRMARPMSRYNTSTWVFTTRVVYARVLRLQLLEHIRRSHQVGVEVASGSPSFPIPNIGDLP